MNIVTAFAAATQADKLMAALLRDADWVTFYDAFEVVACLRLQDRLAASTLQRLLTLHDDSRCTLGGQGILAAYLTQEAQKRGKEEALARRTLVWADRGKRASALVQSTLVLHLEERRTSGLAWEVTHIEGPLRVERGLDRSDAPLTAFFSLTIEGPGEARLVLDEVPAAGRSSRVSRVAASLKQRRFELLIWGIDGSG